MNVLFLGISSYFKREFNELIKFNNAKAHFANDKDEAIGILNSIKIDLIVIDFPILRIYSLINYIYEFHDNIDVILSTDKNTNEFLTLMRTRDYYVLQQPYSLTKLQEYLDKQIGKKEETNVSDSNQF